MAQEVALEAHEIHEKLNELREEQEKSGSFGKFIQLIALATGLMAVCAAVAAQQAASLANEALLLSNRSILAETKASDTWNEYQADGIKRREFETQALVTAASASQSQAFAAEAKREADKQPEPDEPSPGTGVGARPAAAGIRKYERYSRDVCPSRRGATDWHCPGLHCGPHAAQGHVLSRLGIWPPRSRTAGLGASPEARCSTGPTPAGAMRCRALCEQGCWQTMLVSEGRLTSNDRQRGQGKLTRGCICERR